VVDVRDLPHLCCCETGCLHDDEPDHAEHCTATTSCRGHEDGAMTNRTRLKLANDLDSFGGPTDA
jgi:hypothetical protein